MPGLNQQGPLGMGPRSGRGLGRCADGARQDDNQQVRGGRGQGQGRGLGPCGGGRARGRGRGRDFGLGRSLGRGQGYGLAVGQMEGTDLQAEVQTLRQRLAQLEAELAGAAQE